jgi:predicted ester cyclase
MTTEENKALVRRFDAELDNLNPAGSHEILDQVAEGDKVVTRLRAVGTHDADLPDSREPATRWT